MWRHTYYYAVLSNLDVVSDLGCFDDAVGTNMDMISNLHGVIVEVSAIGFVRGPVELISIKNTR